MADGSAREPVGGEAAGVALLAALAAVLLYSGLSSPLLEPEESRYAEIPRQMLARGDFLIPTLDGQPYLDKPPLLYWLVMGGYRVFGVHAWVGRAVASTASLLTVVAVYLWGRRAAGVRAAFLAALVLLLSGEYVYRSRMLTMNGLLALAVTAAVAAGHRALREGPRWWWAAAGAACGLGVLAKGPVALVLVAGPLVVWPWLERGVRRAGVTDWLVFGLAAGAAAGPWLGWVCMTQPGFASYFFWFHHVRRYVTPFDHAKPVWYYLPVVVAGVLPWTLLVVPLVRERRRVAGPVWGLLATAAVGLVFFSLAGSKRAVYLVPVYPPLALGLGCFLAGWEGGRRWLAPAAGATFAVLAAGVVWLGPWYAARFSTSDEVAGEFARLSARGLPVASYPHGWDAVRFALRRDDVRVFGPGERAALYEALERQGETLVVVKSGADWEVFLRDLPVDLAFEEYGRGEIVTAGRVGRRGSVAGAEKTHKRQ